MVRHDMVGKVRKASGLAHPPVHLPLINEVAVG